MLSMLYAPGLALAAVLSAQNTAPIRPAQGDHAPITLAEAERLALARDPGIASLQAQAAAFAERAVADGQLPDPQLKLGVESLPVDTFDRRQDSMTQARLGLVQTIPPAGSLDAKRSRTSYLSAMTSGRVAARRLATLRALRKDYVELAFRTASLELVRENRELFAQLAQIAERSYAAGVVAQQAVTEAELQLLLLDDRQTRLRGAIDRARASLARWVGEAAALPLPLEFPELPPVPRQEALTAGLAEHPELVAIGAAMEAAQAGVALAKARYRPGFDIDLSYGDRAGREPGGEARTDMLSAMVTLDMPLFPGKRQDRRLAASEHELVAARFERSDLLLDLSAELERAYADFERLGERLDHYRERVLAQARLNTEAALLGYRGGTGDFQTSMLARGTELEARLSALRLQAERAKTQAALLYFKGELP